MQDQQATLTTQGRLAKGSPGMGDPGQSLARSPESGTPPPAPSQGRASFAFHGVKHQPLTWVKLKSCQQHTHQWGKRIIFFFLNIKKLCFGLKVDFRTPVKPCASATIEQTASGTPVCSCHMPAALADAGMPSNNQGQRAGGHFPCAIGFGVNKADPEDARLHPLLQKLPWTSSFLLMRSHL